FQGWDRSPDARVVGDLPVLADRHVEVHAHQYALAGQVDVTNGFLVHRQLLIICCLAERGLNRNRSMPSRRFYWDGDDAPTRARQPSSWRGQPSERSIPTRCRTTPAP